MHLILSTFILVYGISLCDSYYAETPDSQSDVQAPSYVPAYLKNQQSGFAARKTYSGTKTGYGGTKTGYHGTKTGNSGTKTGHSGTKSAYGERKTWASNGQGPTFEDFHNSAHQPYMAKCFPECQNNGICVATNTCDCPENYRGQHCEFERKPCLVYPPLPMNSHRNCSSEFCTITCMKGHKFIDGSSVANMKCAEGQWRPTRADFTAIPDCMPQCSPPCVNGGVCLALDTCQCPEDFRGPQCQYASSVCDVRKLAFNGGYSCFGNEEKFSCKLNCPTDSSYSSPQADVYTCLYSTGVFQPQPIPHCVFNEVDVVFPSNYINSSKYYESHSSWTSIGHSESSGTHGHGQYGSHHSQVVIQDLTPKGGSCLTWAGVHYKTFDGKIYSFKSKCRHLLVSDSEMHKVSVVVRPGDCPRTSYCPSEITIYLEDKPYTLSVHPEDNSVIFRSSRRLIPIPASLPGIRVAMPTDRVLVSLDAAALTISWDTDRLITIESSVILWNNTEGLCGMLNSNPEDDLTTKEGSKAKTTAAMASSWQLNMINDICDSNPTELKTCEGQSDEIKKKALQFCSKIFSKDKFRKCSKVLLDACQTDYCGCVTSENPEECACGTVSVYAKECLRHGVEDMKYWRDVDTCPKTCTDGKLYRVCGPEVQPSCAGRGAAGENSSSTGSCVEGCFCPDGLFLEGGRCVPLHECPCRLRNKLFKPGSVIPKDCNTCTCEAGAWTCSAAACGARCGAVGDPHYATFDGRRYDFMGRCSYTLLQALNVTINVDNVACSGAITEAMNLSPYKGEGKPSCTKAVNINYGGAHVHLKQGGLILVNGKEVSALPVTVAGIKIRAASSLFVIVQLPLKVDLWWDGNTRVFVDVPAQFQGETKGLCGTFNMNQQDDFLTPEGDVEQSTLAFANKWKTREFCEDLDTQEPEHPCKVNMQNKEAAEKYCGKLKSKLFEECHWYVDVEPYYEACVYDMCACDGDARRCLCPVLGNYAMACAAAGLRLQWRLHVAECELQCTGGQEFTVCANSCLRTCADVALSTAGHCKPCCVEGCACPIGQVLDETNSCVPEGLCPCNHKGLKFDAGYKEVRPGKRERELCTCVGARWECVPATDNDVQNYPPAEDLRANCSAAKHMEFTSCQLASPLTCKNMHLPPSSSSAECRPGCQCQRGYVLDATAKACVTADQCPCHHGGRSYPDAHVMQEECNECVCKSGNWSCTTRICSGVCAAWGDSHLTTFDATDYDFEGVCSYLLAKGVMDSSDGFDVEIQNVPCGTTGATCSKSTTLKVGGANQEVVSLTKDAPLPDISKFKRIKLREAGSYVFLDVPSLGVSLQWDRGLRVYVRLDAVWRGRVKGLCGNFNGDSRDDFQTPAGGGLAEASPTVFVDAWKLKPTCPPAKPIEDYCKLRPERKDWAVSVCGELKRFPFSLCNSEVSVGAHLSRCEREACACDAGADCRCACAALAHYAHACAQRGITFNWRRPDLCPMQCDAECSHYDSCMSPCPLETCDNVHMYEEVKTTCQSDTCVEGCKPKKTCPEGEVFSNSTLQTCVPRAQCREHCMTLTNGSQVEEGEVLEEDACHTCRCSKGQRVCTGQPCHTEPTSPSPQDESLKCVSGWTSWISRHMPQPDESGASVETEPLPLLKELQIGASMCVPELMEDVECRTKVNHESPKHTGLDVECSLERGLVCREPHSVCPDFEIRVLCNCEAFQCLNSTRPSYQHPSNCSEFYECTPVKPHTVLKHCSQGTFYNPKTMVCDWPAAVIAIRPECGEPSTTESVSTTTTTTEEMPAETSTTEGTTRELTSPEASSTKSVCPPGKVFVECAYPCDQLCDYFKKSQQSRGLCGPGQKCTGECVSASVATKGCAPGQLWRDNATCVPVKDCTCYSDGNLVKPGGVVVDGCVKCQCLSNALHCDSSDCLTSTVQEPRNLPIISTTHQPTTTEPSTTTAIPTTIPPIISSTLVVVNTASPPPECAPEGYKYLLWGDDEEVRPVLTASSVASAQFEPAFAVFDGRPNAISAGSWNPKVNDKNQYIQVELPRAEAIYGVVLQGSPLFDQYVDSYELMYGDDGSTFSYVTQPDGTPAVFRGPVNHNTPLKQMITPPFEAKFVRLLPKTWHEEIAVRLQLIGCGEPMSTTIEEVTTTIAPPVCTDVIGLEGGLPVERIEVSSNNDGRTSLRIGASNGWRPDYSTPGNWIMFDFTSPRNITGIKTKGGHQGWVSTYKVMYTSDLSTFNLVLDNNHEDKLFPGNFDQDTEVFNQFRLPIHARYLKVLPVKWKDAIEMRVEPVGCFEPYPQTTTTLPYTEQGITTPCNVCPGIPEVCVCGAHTYYDGSRCVSRDQCQCVRGYTTYPVGAVFRGDNCDECMCKLGGVADCQPVKECVCSPTLVPKLKSSTCECDCEPCPTGTRICPTSKLCLALDKWCDGLRDCPDDEQDCSTSTVQTSTTTTTTTPQPTLATTLVTIEPEVVTTVVSTVAAIQTTPATTPQPVVCPPVQCPPGYMVKYVSSASHTRSYTSDLPPPRSRITYQRYYRGSKGGYSKGGYSKGGSAKGGYSKGGYNVPTRPLGPNQAFTLEKPISKPEVSSKEACPQFRCTAALPPPPRPGASPPPPAPCAAPLCPPRYSLRLDTTKTEGQPCPQYSCVPPPERLTYCNVTDDAVSTLDGADYKYPLCFHILARDHRHDAWSVIVRKKCRVDGCVNELMVHQDDQLIKVRSSLVIEYDNYEYTVEQTAKICFQKNSFDIAKMGDGISIKSRRYNFTVFYNTDGDIKIGVAKSYMNSVDGLCGAFDGSKNNERRMPDGNIASSAEQMADAWGKPGQAKRACAARQLLQAKKQRAWEVCGVLTEEPLSKCGKILNLDKWRNICLEKMCKCTELVVNGTKKTEEECRCLLVEKMVAECLAADKDVDIAAWRIKLNCPAECPPPLVHHDCYRRRCEPSCSSLGATSCPLEDGHCFPGCYCPAGTLRQGDRCITPDDCRDCNCKSGGAPADITMFEGNSLPAYGNCTYLVSRDTNDSNVHKYEVYTTNHPCEQDKNLICTKAVYVVSGKNVIHLAKDTATTKLTTTVNKEVMFKYPLKNDWVTVNQINGKDVSILLHDAHVEITVQQSKLEWSVLVPSLVYKDRTEGLCGQCGGEGPLRTANKTETDDVDEFGDSWQAPPSALETLGVPPEQQQCSQPPPEPCKPPPPTENACLELYNADAFGACHALIDPAPFVALCEEEQCATNKSDACSTLARYSAACRVQGVCLRWRQSRLCPYTCEAPFVYRPCVDCERTCENHDELQNNPKLCDQPPNEGCFCPEGKVRVNNTCIEPTKCFPCDADKLHFAGDEWQENACKKCICSKMPGENAAHVSCTTQTCAAPVCPAGQDLVPRPVPPGQQECCTPYICLDKPQSQCREPKKMECGYGQVLKQKTTPSGCTEFVCECMPASECEHIPSESEVEMLEAGMERVVDRSGCCPRVELVCRPQRCPPPTVCGPHRHPQALPTKCCPSVVCELPKDKCVTTLTWEASSKGGERSREKTEEVVKDIEETWMDGPCRWCRCSNSSLGPATSCHVSECPALPAPADVVYELRPAPFACCPAMEAVACLYREKRYKAGENWTSPDEPCETFSCEQQADGKLTRHSTKLSCNTDCQPGWKYFPAAAGSEQCCGSCKPVSCVVDGRQYAANQTWLSADFCTQHTCEQTNDSLQVESSIENCPEIPVALKKQFVYSEESVPGQCCKKLKQVACRVGNDIYQEGQTWSTADPCKNVSCVRDSAGSLSHVESVQHCDDTCHDGWEYQQPASTQCCGKCLQRKCVIGELLKEEDSTWQSPDNCTTYTCSRVGEKLVTSAATELCPDVSACPKENLLNDTCCQICQHKPEALSDCAPVEISGPRSIGFVQTTLRPHGACRNAEPLRHFYECRGHCSSGTLYNNATGTHSSQCSCCQALRYEPVDVPLQCADGATVTHRVASPARCGCAACGDTLSGFGNKPTKGGSGTGHIEPFDYDIPEIYQRMKISDEK